MSEDRAVSVTLSYVILLGVATMLMISTVMAVGTVLDSQKNHAVQDELTVTGEGLASELEEADRLYRSTETNASHLVVERRLPTHVSGTSYRIEVNGTTQELTLSTRRPEVSVSIAVNARALGANTSTFMGGPVRIEATDGHLEVSDA